MEIDGAGNIKPSKKKATEKIDGAVALVMAVSQATLYNVNRMSVYDERGLVFI